MQLILFLLTIWMVKLCDGGAGYTTKGAPAVLKLSTNAGDIKIRLRPELSPESIAYIIKVLAQPQSAQHSSKAGRGCSFYRLELAPPPGSEGPPYGLLQGSLAAEGVISLMKAPKSKLVERPELQVGSVAWAGGGLGPDFFVSLVAHPEWKHDHFVWGEVEDMEELAVILKLPTSAAKWGQTQVQVLKQELPFNVTGVPRHRRHHLRHRHSKKWRQKHHQPLTGRRRRRRRRHRHAEGDGKAGVAE
jgi:cyclophilin family peptidyl-prolyl cis-trans isomerase